MRLLMLDNEFPPLGGGTGVINYNVLREMADMDVDVDLVTSSRGKHGVETEAFADRIRIFKVPVDNRDIHHSANTELLRYLFRGARQALALCRERPYDIAIAWAGVPAGGIALRLKQKTGLPYFVSLQGPDVPWYEHRYFWMYPFLSPVIKHIWRQAAAVTASSAAHRDLAIKAAPDVDIETLYNGVNLTEFSPDHARPREPGHPVVLLCSARLIQRKGQADLIRAARIWKERDVGPFEIQLVGQGDDEARLRKLARDHDVEKEVRFLGFQNRSAMPVITASANVFVMPSFNEGMSVALLEALASGLPVAVTDTGGTKELVRDNGVVVPWQDPPALAEKVEPLIRDADLRRRMGARSREIAGEFSWRAVAERYLDVCERALAGRTP